MFEKTKSRFLKLFPDFSKLIQNWIENQVDPWYFLTISRNSQGKTSKFHWKNCNCMIWNMFITICFKYFRFCFQRCALKLSLTDCNNSTDLCQTKGCVIQRIFFALTNLQKSRINAMLKWRSWRSFYFCRSYIKDIDRLVAGWLPCSPRG